MGSGTSPYRVAQEWIVLGAQLRVDDRGRLVVTSLSMQAQTNCVRCCQGGATYTDRWGSVYATDYMLPVRVILLAFDRK